MSCRERTLRHVILAIICATIFPFAVYCNEPAKLDDCRINSDRVEAICIILPSILPTGANSPIKNDECIYSQAFPRMRQERPCVSLLIKFSSPKASWPGGYFIDEKIWSDGCMDRIDKPKESCATIRNKGELGYVPDTKFYRSAAAGWLSQPMAININVMSTSSFENASISGSALGLDGEYQPPSWKTAGQLISLFLRCQHNRCARNSFSTPEQALPIPYSLSASRSDI